MSAGWDVPSAASYATETALGEISVDEVKASKEKTFAPLQQKWLFSSGCHESFTGLYGLNEV